MSVDERRIWCERLRRPALACLAGSPLVGEGTVSPEEARVYIGGFSDEMGHRRGVDRFILAWMLGCPLPEDPAGGITPDVALWRALVEGTDPRPLILAGDGIPTPLTGPPRGIVIETATEAELSALHAVWHHGVRRGDLALQARALSAARWAVANLQPDNATNHPWAAHVFVELGLLEGNREAELYAQTLLHNCMVALGRPDRFSAVILLDASRALERPGSP